jgi:hypothetical protein
MAKTTVEYSEYDKYVVCEKCNCVDFSTSARAAKGVVIGHCPTCAASIKHCKEVLGRWKCTTTKRFMRAGVYVREFQVYDATADKIDDKLEERDL